MTRPREIDVAIDGLRAAIDAVLAQAMPKWTPGEPPQGVNRAWLLVESNQHGDDETYSPYHQVMLATRIDRSDPAPDEPGWDWHAAADAEATRPGDRLDGLVVAWVAYFAPTKPSRSQIEALLNGTDRKGRGDGA